MYQGNSDELKQKIKEYNAGMSGNFIFSRRDLEATGKTLRGTTQYSRNYEYVRDFAITSADLRTEIGKIIREQARPEDNLWSTPQLIYFYAGLRVLDSETWILVKKKSLYEAAKAGSNYTKPALRFTQQTPLEVVDLWGRPNLRETLRIDKEAWGKIEKAEEKQREKEQEKAKEEWEKLNKLWTQTAREVPAIYRDKVWWEELEFSDDCLKLFFNDKCSCDKPVEDWSHHMLKCCGQKFAEVEEFTQKLKSEIQKAVDKFIQWKESLIKKVEAELTAKGLTEAEVFDSEFYSFSIRFNGDWRASIRSSKDKSSPEHDKEHLISYIESKSRLKNNTPPPDREPGSENRNENQNTGSQSREDWWEKEKQKFAQKEQAAREKEAEANRKRKEKQKEREKKAQQQTEEQERDWKNQQKQNQKGDYNNNGSKSEKAKIPTSLSPENLEEIPTDKKSPSSNGDKDSPVPQEPNQEPPKKPSKKEETREAEIKRLKTEIENLKKISNRTPQQEKELKEKEDRLRWLEDITKSDNNPHQEKSSTEKTTFRFWGGKSLFLSGGLILVGFIVLLVILLYVSQKKKKKTELEINEIRFYEEI